MEKVSSVGPDFVPKEVARLTALIASPSVSASDKKTFTIRRNILSRFAAVGKPTFDSRTMEL